MQFSDLELSRRLERAEGRAGASYCEARRRLFPQSGSEWIECAGAYAIFDGSDSPITQTFGLGIFEELTPAALDKIERFFLDRGAPVHHEVSPFAGPAALELLCARHYTPVEVSNVLYCTVGPASAEHSTHVEARAISPHEASLWTEISAKGWAHDHPEFLEFLRQHGAIASACEHYTCFLAEFDGQPGAAGLLCIHGGVALFGGSATIPELRRRGLQTALLHERMRFASDHGCDAAMMVALPGSDSQRNAERKGFRIAYTRTKWRLRPQA